MSKYWCKRSLDDCIWLTNSGDFFSSVNCWSAFIGNSAATWISQDSQVKFMSKEHLHFMWENFIWKVNYILSAYDMILWYLTHTNVFMWENFKWNSCEVISIKKFTVTGNSCECPFHKKSIWRTSSWHCFLALHADVLSFFVCVFVDDQPVSVPPTLLFPVPGQYSGRWVRNGSRLSARAATHVRGTYHTHNTWYMFILLFFLHTPKFVKMKYM